MGIVQEPNFIGFFYQDRRLLGSRFLNIIICILNIIIFIIIKSINIKNIIICIINIIIFIIINRLY
jgi:hypothetical protein